MEIGKSKLKVLIVLILIFLFLFAAIADIGARRGCCSHHGGVCGCRCCDGTPLSAKCAPYYPQCGDYMPPTSTPSPTPTPSPIPTPVQTPTPFVETPSISPYVWKYPLNTSKLGESSIVIKVVDGDTFDVEGIGRIRFADINTPEIDIEAGKEAKEYVYGLCYQKKVYLDIDDLYITGKYGRIVAVVYIPYNETHFVNLNQLLLKEGYAEARDYPNEFNPDVWQRSPLEYLALTPSLIPSPSPVYAPSPTPIPGFEFLFAIIGILVAIYLVRRRG